MEFGLELAEAVEELVVVVSGDELVRVSVCGGISFCRVAAPCVAGDPAGVGWCAVDGERRGGVVVQAADDDGARPRHRHLHAAAQKYALVVAAFEILHLACSAGGDPCGKTFGIELGCVVARVCCINRGDACDVESGLGGLLAQPLLKLESPLASR